MGTQNPSSSWRSADDGRTDSFDQAISRRLARLASMPVDTASLDARLRAVLARVGAKAEPGCDGGPDDPTCRFTSRFGK